MVAKKLLKKRLKHHRALRAAMESLQNYDRCDSVDALRRVLAEGDALELESALQVRVVETTSNPT